jgi:hypothetical protein
MDCACGAGGESGSPRRSPLGEESRWGEITGRGAVDQAKSRKRSQYALPCQKATRRGDSNVKSITVAIRCADHREGAVRQCGPAARSVLVITREGVFENPPGRGRGS